MAVFDTATAVRVTPSSTFAAVLWVGLASTLHRLRRGEGALLAVNLSLIVHAGADISLALAQTLVSMLAIASMYAFNDFYDAPTDLNNPKKARTLVATYLEYRRASIALIVALKVLTLTLALSTLGSEAAAIVACVFLVNIVYSTIFKGLPVIDVAWCGLWGALYVAIVDAAPEHIVLIGVMTAICHLYQTLGDRVSDAANGIVTTAVRSPMLSKSVLFVLSLLVFLAVRAPLGGLLGLTAFAPFLLSLALEAHTGWLLSKVYFGIVWLYILGFFHAAG